MAECRSAKCEARIVYARPVGGGSLMPVDWPAQLDQPGWPCQHEGDLIVWAQNGGWWYRPAGKCTTCHHAHEGKVCAKLGPVTCRTMGAPGSAISVRGKFPCGCEQHEREQPAPGEHRAISHYATCPDAAAWRRKR